MKSLSHIKKDLRDLGLNISSVKYLLNFALNNKDQLSLITNKDDLVGSMSPFLYRAVSKKNHIYKSLSKLGIYNLFITNKDNDKFVVLFKHKDGGLITSEVIRSEYNRKPNMAECLALTIIDYAEQISDPNKLDTANNVFADAELSNRLKIMLQNMQKNTSLMHDIDKEWPDALERSEAILGEHKSSSISSGLTLDQAPSGLKEAFIKQIRAEELRQKLGHEVTVAVPH